MDDVDIPSQLEDLGYVAASADIDDVRFHMLDTLALDIAAGESAWPVDTGYSVASFFTDGSNLYNYAVYAPIVEARTGAITDFFHSNITELIEVAAELSGVPKQSEVQDAPNLEELSVLVEQRLRSELPPRAVGQPVFRATVIRDAVRRLGGQTRRWVRTIRPPDYRDYIYRDYPDA